MTSKSSKELIFRKILPQNVLLIKLFPGITEAVLNHMFQMPQLKGVILETYGSGNAPTEKWFLELLRNTLQKGIPIVDITQCFAGSVVLGKYETSLELLEMGLIDGKDITTEAAITKLMYLFSIPEIDGKVKDLFETSLRGEIGNT